MVNKKTAKLAKDHPFISVKKVVKTFNYKKHPVAIVDTFQFGGIWSPNNKLIMVDEKSWNKLSKKEKNFVLEHERRERILALKKGYQKFRSHAEAVKYAHDKVNKSLKKKFGNRLIKKVAP